MEAVAQTGAHGKDQNIKNTESNQRNRFTGHPIPPLS